jgi:SAM-dependent methyltransferase
VSPGSVSKRPLFEGRHYTGFDLYRDANTDVVGDAHRLSSYFDGRFDAIFSLSVLEHLAYPWIFAYEVNKSLKVGGFTFHATHFHWPEHEAPADYFRFSDWGLESLFGPMFGFRVIKSGVFAPAYMDLYDNTKHEGMKDAHCWGGSAILAVKETTPPFFLDSNAVDSFFERIYPKHEST